MKCSHKILRCSWIDADEDSGWTTYEKKAPWVVNTIGYLVELPKKKSDFLVLANSHLPDQNHWSGLTRIPKGMILGIETLLTAAPCGYSLKNDDTSDNPRRTRSLPVR